MTSTSDLNVSLAKMKAERNKSLTRLLKETETRYLGRMPRKIPDGKVLAHNHVYPVARQPGTRGSRIWTQILKGDPKLVVCDCGWAPELGSHYRVFGTRVQDN
jgi:hypothetical protein